MSRPSPASLPTRRLVDWTPPSLLQPAGASDGLDTRDRSFAALGIVLVTAGKRLMSITCILLSVGLLGCDSTSDEVGSTTAASCEAPPLVTELSVEPGPSLLVPKIQHDLVLEFVDSDAAENAAERFHDLTVSNSSFGASVSTVGTVVAGRLLLIEYDTQADLDAHLCLLLGTFLPTVAPSSVLVLDADGVG